MVRVQNLTFEYTQHQTKNIRVLDGVHFEIQPGETIGLMGANGSGKTTLARCLNGLLLPTEGAVWVDELDTRRADEAVEIRRRVGMVFQNPENQIVSTTVEREIAFGLENLGVPAAEMHRIVDDMLQKFNLESLRLQPPHRLSGGEMQRLALAAVMAMSPRYLIFDEPTSLLDPPSRKAVISLILNLNKMQPALPSPQAITTLFITQFPEEVLLFDRLLVLHEGKIVRDDRPEIIFQEVEQLNKMGLNVPPEYELNHYLKLISDGQFSLNTSDFLPIT
ncbi:MAG: ATP-binding cassette domain-containing protein [bacterium]